MFLTVIIWSVLMIVIIKKFVGVGIFIFILGLVGFVISVVGAVGICYEDKIEGHGHYLSIVITALIFSLHFFCLHGVC
jgi:hypothetical protein